MKAEENKMTAEKLAYFLETTEIFWGEKSYENLVKILTAFKNDTVYYEEIKNSGVKFIYK